jgi:hypothetical protein
MARWCSVREGCFPVSRKLLSNYEEIRGGFLSFADKNDFTTKSTKNTKKENQFVNFVLFVVKKMFLKGTLKPEEPEKRPTEKIISLYSGRPFFLFYPFPP